MKKWLFILLMFPTILFAQTSNKCVGETLTLWVDSNTNWSYKWIVEPPMQFYGQSTPSIRIDSLPEQITVWVEVSNSSGCVGEAILTLISDDCGWSIYFPNAIILSGVNTTWFPKFTNVLIKELTIWDRWGHVQWQWNGNGEFLGFNDKGSQLDGVFTFLCIYSPQGKKVEYQHIGKIVIIR
jgi:hypothetical protein